MNCAVCDHSEIAGTYPVYMNFHLQFLRFHIENMWVEVNQIKKLPEYMRIL